MAWARTRATALTALGVAAAVVALYGRTVGAYFFEDDFQWLASTWTFTLPSLLNIPQHTHFYRPFIEIYFAWGPKIFGHAAAPFHVFSIAVHIANGIAVYVLARMLLNHRGAAAFAALAFVAMPGYVHAVAWVGAIAEPLTTLFFLVCVAAFIRWLQTGGRAMRLASIAAFGCALLTHESAATLIVLLAAAHWTTTRDAPVGRGLAGVYLPYLAMLIPYAIVATVVSRQNYVVEEGHYRLGAHVVMNLLNYIVSLYVGKRTLATYIAIAIAVPALFAFGSRQVRFSLAWVLVTLMPFVFFTWGNTSRYLYTPSAGFAILLACGLAALDRWLAPRLNPAPRSAILGGLALAVVVRFAVFANQGVRHFVADTHAYRAYLADFRRAHPSLARDAAIEVPPLADERLRPVYVEAMVRWEYEAPDARLIFSEP